MEYQTLIIEIVDHVATLTINRPECMNAINGQLMDDFSAALDSIEFDDRVRALIVTGGDKVFAAGADIKEISRLDTPTAAHAFVLKIQKIFKRLQSLEMPVIAAISGLALGGGCELVLACDCRHCSGDGTIGASGNQSRVDAGCRGNATSSPADWQCQGNGNAFFRPPDIRDNRLCVWPCQ
jgi:enoyl-CoA hydratase